MLLVFRKKDLYLVITQKLTFMKSGGFHMKASRFCADFMKSSRFQVKSSGFHVDFRWNLVDFRWNPADFMWISCRFHEICQISCGFHEISRFHADFMKSSRFHVKSTYKTYKSNISRKTLQFYGVLWEGYVMFSHEIRRISKDQLLCTSFSRLPFNCIL